MGYTINTKFGRVDYYDNYGFDYIAQYRDEHGIMFGNYTKDRIECTPLSTGIIAIFRITNRKTEATPHTYLVYYTDTLIIKETFGWMGKAILNLLNTDKRLKCINRTNPKAKQILNSINLINGTNY